MLGWRTGILIEDDFFPVGETGEDGCLVVCWVGEAGFLSDFNDPQNVFLSVSCLGCNPHQYFGCKPVRLDGSIIFEAGFPEGFWGISTVDVVVGGMTTLDAGLAGIIIFDIVSDGNVTLDECLGFVDGVLTGFKHDLNMFSVEEALLGCSVGGRTLRVKTGVNVTMEVLVGFFLDASAAV